MSQLELTKLAERFRSYYPVIIDIETAGFNPQTDAILEIAATSVTLDENGNLKPFNTYSYNVKPFPNANLLESSLRFTGIDPHCPNRNAQDEKTVLNHLFKNLKEEQKIHGCSRCVVVAHNAAFDNGFLSAAIARTNHKRSPFHPFVTFDTTTLSGLCTGKTVLAESCGLMGVAFDKKQAHSAAYDSQKTAELFCAIVNHYHALGGWPFALTTKK